MILPNQILKTPIGNLGTIVCERQLKIKRYLDKIVKFVVWIKLNCNQTLHKSRGGSRN